MKTLLTISMLTFFALTSFAEVENTSRGKIEFTEGHMVPNCRTISFVDNETGVSQRFRIADIENSDISSIVLTAFATQKDIQIWYEQDISTGCGDEPKIRYIRVYN